MLNRKAHIRYFQYFLALLPTRVQSQASNLLMLVYFTVSSLKLLKYEFSEVEKGQLLEFVKMHLVQSGEGFRGGLVHRIEFTDSAQTKSGSEDLKIDDKSTYRDNYIYDPATLAGTYAALCILSVIGVDFDKVVSRNKIMSQLRSCQQVDGAFSSYVVAYSNQKETNKISIEDELDTYVSKNGDKLLGDGDLRLCYLAASIRKILLEPNTDNITVGSTLKDIDVKSLESYIIKQVQYDGGLGSNESHAGLTFCGIAALKLLKSDTLTLQPWHKTINWLLHRQITHNDYNDQLLLQNPFTDISDEGAFNGRENKLGDTCYSFWVLGSLKILGVIDLVDAANAKEYLLKVTQKKLGGFGKTDVDDADPYHGFLGLCALSLLKDDELDLGQLDEELVIPL